MTTQNYLNVPGDLMKVPPAKTGWPPGLLQDDCRKLHQWFASRLDAREVVRRVFCEFKDKA